MPDDPRVQSLLEELLDSGATPEAVCAAHIDLLPLVRERWQKVVRMRAEIEDLFPPKLPSTSGQALSSTVVDAPFPEIPGYQVETVLGTGGMGVVFKTRHLQLNRIVALKMTLLGSYAGTKERERFQREAESVAALRHPNVVQIHDIGESQGKAYFTMEYVEGGSLAERLTGKPIPARDAASLVAALASAVHAAHTKGIVHRDLKPGNVLLTADGVPKISDFGLARRLDDEAGLTRTGIALGTPSYMAPEQARGKLKAVGPSADIYSLGAILYELLTGRPPFLAQSGAETVHQLLTQDPVPPSRLNGKVPRDLETICLKCLAKEAKLRYATAAALSEDLGRFLDGDAISARPEGRMRRAMRAVRRRPTLAVGSTAAALFLVLALAGGMWLFFDRAFIHREVSNDLVQIDEHLQRYSFQEAKAAIERAQARLGSRDATALRQLLKERLRDCQLADLLEQINLNSAINVDDLAGYEQADKNYDKAFHEFGIGRFGDDHQTVASHIRGSRIHRPLLAALDRWSVVTRIPERAAWVLRVADLAEPDRTPWRTDARDPKIRQDRKALQNLMAQAEIPKESASLLLAVSAALKALNTLEPGPMGQWKFDQIRKQDSEYQIPFLTEVQRAYPDNLWANIYLGFALILGNKPDQSIRYLQNVIALRPNWSVGYHFVGIALGAPASSRGPERFAEAIEYFRKAVQLDPHSAKPSHSLAVALLEAGKLDEAAAQAEKALHFNYNVGRLHAILGTSLNAKGRIEESLAQFRLGFAVDPDDWFVLNRYRAVLAKELRWEELRTVWGQALQGHVPNHDTWYGYAELCLYLGQEEEYRRARKALLARFAVNPSLQTAERTARACLLHPASAEELGKAVALANFAAQADRKQTNGLYGYYQFVKGFAEYRQGHFDQAIAMMRGEASKIPGPLPPLVLSMALHEAGKKDEARKVFTSVMLDHEWRENQMGMPDTWVRHVLRREAERTIHPTLAAMVEGKQEPRNNDERLAQLGICRFENRFAALSRIYAEAFAADPKLASKYRFRAARVAAQAGCGRGSDTSHLADTERRKLRAQARAWLGEELSVWKVRLDRNVAGARDAARQELTKWCKEPELAGIRESAELEKLPADEKEDCRRLWDEVKTVLDSTSQPNRQG